MKILGVVIESQCGACHGRKSVPSRSERGKLTNCGRCGGIGVIRGRMAFNRFMAAVRQALRRK